MIHKVSNRKDPEQIFIAVRNTSGSTISADCPVFFEHDAVTDGNAVSQASASEQFCLFAGITDEELSDDEYGLVQTYGYRQSCYVSAASAGCEVGLALLPVKGQNYLTDSTSSARHDWNFVNLFETIGAGAGASAVTQYKVLIRAF